QPPGPPPIGPWSHSSRATRLVAAPDVVGELDAVLLDRVGHGQAGPERELARCQLRRKEDLGPVAEDEVIRMTLPQDADDDPARHGVTSDDTAMLCHREERRLRRATWRPRS